MVKQQIYLISHGVSHSKLLEFKERLDKISKYEGVYDKGEEKSDQPEAIREYLQNLMNPCKIAVLLLGMDSEDSRYLKHVLKIGLEKKRAAFRLDGEHTVGSSKGLPTLWKQGLSVYQGDMATVKRMLDWLNWPFF